MSLASLTATYTDSEGEEDDGNEKNNDDVVLSTPQTSPDRSNSSKPGSPVQVRVTSKVAKLVSYHDDTIVSDDEGETLDAKNTLVILENEREIHDADEDDDNNAMDEEDDNYPDEEGVNLPPEPTGTCSGDLQEKIQKLYDRMLNEALDMNAVIQQRKDFRNPSIYEKLIQFCSINELGTNYPPSIYDPLKWNKESFYEDLARVQKVEMDRREKDRKSKVEVVSGTKKQEDDAKKRKSKWDQPGGNAVMVSQSLKPAGLVQPSLTTNATGTKATVISAFGSLLKKPRP